MGVKKEAGETVVKKGKKLGLFQKFYKQYLKMFKPKEAREAAKKAAKEAEDAVINKKIADSAKTIKSIKKKAIIGGTGLGALDVGTYGVTGESPILGPTVQKLTGLKKGGYVKMKKGGSVKKSSSKKSRGTGAAKRGTKFKGVF